MNTLQRIGQVTKNMRVARGLSQEQFCAQCGIDQHYISNIENGQRNISVDVVERISTFFRLTLCEFFAAVETVQMHSQKSSMVCETNRHHQTCTYSAETIKEKFIRYLKAQGFSQRTINSYSNNTPNSMDVRNIIFQVANTQNMYELTSKNDLKHIIEKVSSSIFNKTGHNMYSAGIKKYLQFLIDLGMVV